MQACVWPLLRNLFVNVLLEEDWLSLWDHALVHPLSFLLYFAAAYIVAHRKQILSMRSVEQVEVGLSNSELLPT